jgi:hypothetical protein
MRTIPPLPVAILEKVSAGYTTPIIFPHGGRLPVAIPEKVSAGATVSYAIYRVQAIGSDFM